MEMTKGCKIWLWLILIGAGFNIIFGLSRILSGNLTTGLLYAADGGVYLNGALLLLKKQKKGFYIIAATGVLTFFLNLSAGLNVAASFISVALNVGITYFFVHNNEYVFR